jgi:hypothetical protein
MHQNEFILQIAGARLNIKYLPITIQTDNYLDFYLYRNLSELSYL